MIDDALQFSNPTYSIVFYVLVGEFNVEPCSMIREGAVCRPSPPSKGWNPTDEDFEKDGARVLAAFKNHVHRASVSEENDYSTVLICHGAC
jgi:hypothetical protein